MVWWDRRNLSTADWWNGQSKIILQYKHKSRTSIDNLDLLVYTFALDYLRVYESIHNTGHPPPSMRSPNEKFWPPARVFVECGGVSLFLSLLSSGSKTTEVCFALVLRILIVLRWLISVSQYIIWVCNNDIYAFTSPLHPALMQQ